VSNLQIAKTGGQDPATPFAWEFAIVLTALKYWSPVEQLGAVKHSEVAARLTHWLCLSKHVCVAQKMHYCI